MYTNINLYFFLLQSKMQKVGSRGWTAIKGMWHIHGGILEHMGTIQSKVMVNRKQPHGEMLHIFCCYT